MATLNCGTLNFGDDVFVDTRPQIRDSRGERAGSLPELECYEAGHIDGRPSAWVREGELIGPLHFQFVLGVPGGIGAREDDRRAGGGGVAGPRRTRLTVRAWLGLGTRGESGRPRRRRLLSTKGCLGRERPAGRASRLPMLAA